MFHFGSKLLLLFLLAFPCGLISVGKWRFLRRFAASCRRWRILSGALKKFWDYLTYWRGSHTARSYTHTLQVSTSALLMYARVLVLLKRFVVKKSCSLFPPLFWNERKPPFLASRCRPGVKEELKAANMTLNVHFLRARLWFLWVTSAMMQQQLAAAGTRHHR